MIPYGKQDINQDDIDAVVEVLRSDMLTQGAVVPQFEAAVAEYCGVDHGIAVNSGTSALHIACLALGLGPGDYGWTSPITFVASANCIRYCGAKVDFVDVEPSTGNMSTEALEEKLIIAEREGRLPKVLIPVHLAGQPCNMEGIGALARRYGVRVVEDASHALGGSDGNRPVGGNPRTAATIFSFHPVKLITTGEGGMVMTQDRALAEKMRELRSHGITRDAKSMTHAPDGPWYYQQLTLGFNYRLTDIQAALGLSQLQRLDDYIARRNKLADRYDELLAGLLLETPVRRPDSRSAFHLYIIGVHEDPDVASRRMVFERLRAAGIGVNVHYIPVHTQPYYQTLGFRDGEYPGAEAFYRRIISLPLYPALTEAAQDRVAAVLEIALQP